VAIQSDGQIVLAGNSYVGSTLDFLVARFNGAKGSLDTTFGVGGVAVSSGMQAAGWGVAFEPDGRIVVAGSDVPGGSGFALARFLATGPQIGSFTASPNPVTGGNSLALTASNISDANPGASITGVTFYVDSNGDGVLEPGADTLLGYATQTSPGTWTFTFSTTGLTAGTYTFFAVAEDSFGVVSDPLWTTEQVV
jgi:hypothetical protein